MNTNFKQIIKKYYMVFLLILFIPFAVLLLKWQRDVSRSQLINLDTTQIAGKIKNIDGKKGGTLLKVYDYNYEMYFPDFYVVRIQPQHSKDLYDIAEKGDSIYKAAYSDTLFLYKQNGKNYFFVFDRDDLYW